MEFWELARPLNGENRQGVVLNGNYEVSGCRAERLTRGFVEKHLRRAQFLRASPNYFILPADLQLSHLMY